MKEVRLPRLLDKNLLEVARLHPDSLSVDLSLSPLSTASMSVSQDEATISTGQFVELYTIMGSAGMFVVKSVSYDPDLRRQDIELEHGLATLANNLMEGEDLEKEGTARELLSELLACQSRRMWVLGDVDVPEGTVLKWTCDYSNVLQSIVNLMEQLPAYMLRLDQSAIPWTLSVVEMPKEDGCECRLTRNLESLSVEFDRTDLCTRLYIRGMAKAKKEEEDQPGDDIIFIEDGEEGEEEDLAPLSPDFKLPPAETLVEVYSETLEADTIATWGIVERVLEADMELPRNELIRQGRLYLEERKNPAITITMDAFDLYQATGEPFDRFYLGRICRVCLPEYGAVLRHRVVALTFPDALGEPERVTVTLAAKRADGIDAISGIIVQTAMMYDQIGRLQISKIATNGLFELLADQIRLHAKHILLEADKIELLAEEIKLIGDRVEINAEDIKLWGEITDGLNKSFAEIRVDVENALISLDANQKIVSDLGERVSAAEIKVDGANAKIDLYATRTDETIEGLTQRVTAAEIDIDGANAAILLKASQSDVDDLDERVTSAEIDIDGANAAILLKANASTVSSLGNRVSSAEIAIDGLESEITLKADKIDLQGFVTADDLETEILNVLKVATIENLVVDFLAASQISGSNLDIFCDEVDASNVDADVVQAKTLWATGAHIATLAATDVTLSTLNGYTASHASVNVVVADPQIVKATETITYLDGSGNAQTITVVTGVALQTQNKANISYLQLY